MKRTIKITLTLLGAGWLALWLLGKGYQKGVAEERAKRTEALRKVAEDVFDQYLAFDHGDRADHQNESPSLPYVDEDGMERWTRDQIREGFSFNHTPAENFARVWPARGDQ